MQQYEVKVLEVFSYIVKVEAESEQAAQAAAEKLVWHGNYPDGEDLPDAVYDYTLPRDEWKVWEA